MDGRGRRRAGAELSDRRAVTRGRPPPAGAPAARRSRASRLSSSSALLAALILTSKGWPTVKETFFSWDAFKDSFPDVLDGFWLDVKLFVVVEVAVLALGLVIALAGRRARRRSPAAAARRGLHRRPARHPDDPRRLPDRVRRPGAGAVRRADRPGRARRHRARALPTPPMWPRSTARGSSPCTRARRAAALALGLTPAQAMRHVVLPQAVRRVMPPLLNDFIALQKDVALISILGPLEAFRRAQIEARRPSTTRRCSRRRCCTCASPIPLARMVDRCARDRLLRRRGGGMTRRRCSSFTGSRRPTATREVLRGIDLAVRRARGGRADRRLGLGQVDAAALHRPARGDRRRRRPARRRGHHRSRRSTPSQVAAPARRWCSRPSTCSRT